MYILHKYSEISRRLSLGIPQLYIVVFSSIGVEIHLVCSTPLIHNIREETKVRKVFPGNNVFYVCIASHPNNSYQISWCPS